MDLFEVKKPLVIIHPLGGRRIIAALFKTDSGICFFDIGWADPMGGTHPIHFIDGEISGEGPWMIGDARIEIIIDPHELSAYSHNKEMEELSGVDDPLRKSVFERELLNKEE